MCSRGDTCMYVYSDHELGVAATRCVQAGGWTCVVSHVTRLHSNRCICIHLLHVVRWKQIEEIYSCNGPCAWLVMQYDTCPNSLGVHVWKEESGGVDPLPVSSWRNLASLSLLNCSGGSLAEGRDTPCSREGALDPDLPTQFEWDVVPPDQLHHTAWTTERESRITSLFEGLFFHSPSFHLLSLPQVEIRGCPWNNILQQL